MAKQGISTFLIGNNIFDLNVSIIILDYELNTYFRFLVT